MKTTLIKILKERLFNLTINDTLLTATCSAYSLNASLSDNRLDIIVSIIPNDLLTIPIVISLTNLPINLSIIRNTLLCMMEEVKTSKTLSMPTNQITSISHLDAIVFTLTDLTNIIEEYLISIHINLIN